jgi:hypothetical protein
MPQLPADRPSPNRARLLATARRLGSLCDEVVFVGGQVTELLVTDPAAARIRPTVDVDVVVPVASRAGWQALERRLASLGFHPDRRRGAPICRFRSEDDLVLDAMPRDARILGFTNPWYELAVDSSERHVLDTDIAIRRPTAPAFLATK